MGSMLVGVVCEGCGVRVYVGMWVCGYKSDPVNRAACLFTKFLALNDARKPESKYLLMLSALTKARLERAMPESW